MTTWSIMITEERIKTSEERIKLTSNNSMLRVHECTASIKQHYRYGDDVAGVTAILRCCYVCKNVIDGYADDGIAYLRDQLLDEEDKSIVSVDGVKLQQAVPFTVLIDAEVHYASIVISPGKWKNSVELVYDALELLDGYVNTHAPRIFPCPAYPALAACTPSILQCTVTEQLTHGASGNGVEVAVRNTTHECNPINKTSRITTRPSLTVTLPATAPTIHCVPLTMQCVSLADFHTTLTLSKDGNNAGHYIVRAQHMMDVINEFYGVYVHTYIDASNYFMFLGLLINATHKALCNIINTPHT